MQDAPKGPWANALYAAATRTRLHVGVTQMIPRRLVLRRVKSYLQGELGEELHSLRHVYIGHLHEAFSDYRLAGLVFHSSGAAIEGLRLRILEFDYEQEEFRAGLPASTPRAPQGPAGEGGG